MPNLNKVLLIGNLTRDPDLRHTPKGTPVADISLAINRTWSDESGARREEVTFVDITLWNRQAELAAQYLKKGRSSLIEGRLHIDTWDDKATGQKRSRLKVVAESLQFLGAAHADAPSSPAHGLTPAESSARARETRTQREQRENGSAVPPQNSPTYLSDNLDHPPDTDIDEDLPF